MKMNLIILLILCLFWNTGCSYRVKNDQHKIYLKPQYGMDKFVVIQGYNIHYVESRGGGTHSPDSGSIQYLQTLE